MPLRPLQGRLMGKRRKTKSLDQRRLDMMREHANPLLAEKIKRRGPSTMSSLLRRQIARQWHVDAAEEIEDAFIATTRPVSAKTMRTLSTPSDGPFFDAWPSRSIGKGESNHELLLRRRLASWWVELRNRRIEASGYLVYAVVLDGLSLRDLERTTGKPRKKLGDALISALDVYAELAGFLPNYRGKH